MQIQKPYNNEFKLFNKPIYNENRLQVSILFKNSLFIIQLEK